METLVTRTTSDKMTSWKEENYAVHFIMSKYISYHKNRRTTAEKPGLSRRFFESSERMTRERDTNQRVELFQTLVCV